MRIVPLVHPDHASTPEGVEVQTIAAKLHALLEDDGILTNVYVEDQRAPGLPRDVLWVRPNTTVGVARVAQSIEGQFLSGQFTRAADFRDSPAGGTVAAATGVFCEGDSIGCCRPTRR